MDLPAYVARRLLQMVPVVLGVTILVFFMIHLVPGDPARTMLGTHASPERIALLHKEWGLDESLPAQYVKFMQRLVHGDLGNSLFYRVPARELIVDRYGPRAVRRRNQSIPCQRWAASTGAFDGARRICDPRRGSRWCRARGAQSFRRNERRRRVDR